MTEVHQRTKARRHRPRQRRPNTTLYGLRINAGLSRQDLGYRIGVSAETIRLAELGVVPGPRIQFALAREFGMQPLELWPLEHQKALAA